MGKTEHLDRLVVALTTLLRYKCQNLMSCMCGSVVLPEAVNLDPFILVDEAREDTITT